MYKVLKEKGNNQIITLENTESKVSIILGKLTTDIMKILEKEIKFEGTAEIGVRLKDKWDLEISHELAKELSVITIPIRKPMRKKPGTNSDSQSEQKTTKHNTKSDKKVVDVFDLIFGTE